MLLDDETRGSVSCASGTPGGGLLVAMIVAVKLCSR